MHVPVVLGVTEAAARLGLTRPWLVGLAWGALGVGLFVGRARAGMADRRRSGATVWLLDIPYYVHWCAALFTLIPSVVETIVAPLVQLIRGEPIAASARRIHVDVRHRPRPQRLRRARAQALVPRRRARGAGVRPRAAARRPAHRPPLRSARGHTHPARLGDAMAGGRQRAVTRPRRGHGRPRHERQRVRRRRGRRGRRAARQDGRLSRRWATTTTSARGNRLSPSCASGTSTCCATRAS